ncbi:MAG: hypothetical protein ACTS78_00730 [Arsenophonus sp. NC-WZS1-MAG3]
MQKYRLAPTSNDLLAGITLEPASYILPTAVRGLMMLTVPIEKTMGVSDKLDAEESIKVLKY